MSTYSPNDRRSSPLSLQRPDRSDSAPPRHSLRPTPEVARIRRITIAGVALLACITVAFAQSHEHTACEVTTGATLGDDNAYDVASRLEADGIDKIGKADILTEIDWSNKAGITVCASQFDGIRRVTDGPSLQITRP